MNLVLLDGYTLMHNELDWSALAPDCSVTSYDRTPADQIVTRIGNAELVLTNKTPITAQTLAACPQLRYIGVLATGYNVVDMAAAKAAGVTVTNVPSYSTNAVAQFTIAMLLEICQHVAHHDAAVHQGRWTSCADFCFWDHPLIELADKTIGIVGFGRIGQATGKIAAAMGMRVLADNHRPTEQGRAIATYVPLEELFAQADVLALHCPLTPETQGMINRTSIAQMKDGVILLNNSRGPLIVEADLAEALNSGKVYAAGLDVVSSEPISPNNPLLQAKNCLITPHISWAPLESRTRLRDIAVQNVQAFLRGTPKNVVGA